LARLGRGRFEIAAFAIPLVVRAIPEILAGPYPLGWDVIAYYVPNSLDLAAGRMDLWSIVTSPPLMYSLVVPVYILTKASLFLIFKVLGPLLFGGLAWSIFRFCRKRLFWPEGKALFGVLFAVGYFVLLRVSWDAFQLELGLTLFLLSLSLGDTVGRSLGQAVLLSLAVLSNQLVGVLVVGYAAFNFYHALTNGTGRRFLVQVPAAALFLLVLYATSRTALAPGFSVLGNDLAVAVFAYNIAFFVYAYLLVIPLVILGLNIVQKAVFWPWLLVCVGGLALSTVSGHVFEDIGYRWVLILSIPILL
jgi:hypothetical protein